MNRRNLLGAVLALSAAPAIVKASSLMKLHVDVQPFEGLVLDGYAFSKEEAISYAYFNVPRGYHSEAALRTLPDAARELIIPHVYSDDLCVAVQRNAVPPEILSRLPKPGDPEWGPALDRMHSRFETLEGSDGPVGHLFVCHQYVHRL